MFCSKNSVRAVSAMSGKRKSVRFWTSNHFALKFFRPKEDGVDFDKIGKELAVWKQLKGLPHIISVIELDRFEDYVYVVSDFADGGAWKSWL